MNIKRLFVYAFTVMSAAVIFSFVVSAQANKKEKKQPAATPMPTPAADFGSAISSLRFREIGPAVMGGRIDDIEAVPSDPRIIYVATAAGGIFKSTNAGTSWTPIFDKENIPTIGDIAIAPSDPSIIWAGTGESNNRQSSSWGGGIYRSLDAGKTWEFMGLPETRHIARIVIHPRDPNTVYVAATGNLWGPNKERGVYRTSDGGKNWQLVLKVDENTGATDIAIDPESPGTIYAAMYQRRRTAYGFNGSGAGSALYKTIDGGDNWKKLTNGLPYNTENAPTPLPENLLETGRIAVEVYKKDPNVVYALVEHANGGVYRSNDKGETWRKVGDTNPRPMYFSQIRIDPSNDQRLWIAGVTMQFSEDGGKTFTGDNSRAPHADTHGIWIDPNNSDHLIMGNDGGINITWDRGKTWDYANTVAIGQFYEIDASMDTPYVVCGGLQDNNTWCGPSMSFNPRGISNDDWFTIGGGDGFYARFDTSDTSIVYAESQDGNLLRRNLKTGESKGIRPREDEGEKPFRFQWNSPIVISAYDAKTIYYAGNFVFKSPDRGDTWTKVSPDLTTNVDRNTLPIMGKVPDKNTRSRHDGVQQYPTISSISESPVNKNVLWAGTDDGNLQVTRDGQNWKNVVDKVPGLPKGTYVSRVIASKFNEGTAYATFDGHRNGDFKVYVYATSDFGETWTSISSDIPQNNGVANVIREHPRNGNLLFVGTEYGAYVSFNKGGSWSKMKMNMPTVPVDDILIHPRENDLIFGTHGRSIWIMDDITPLEQMNEATLSSPIQLFDIRKATMWRTWNNKPLTSDKVFYGQNPPTGALVNFFLKDALGEKESVAITIQDEKGQTVRTANCVRRPAPGQAPQQGQGRGQGGGGGFGGFGGGNQSCFAEKGLNRFVWDLRSRPAAGPMEGQMGGGGFGGFGQAGFRVDPGVYTVKLKFGSTEVSKTVTVEEDPRVSITPEQRAAKRAALAKLQPVMMQGMMAQSSIVGLRTNLATAIESWKKPGAPRVPAELQKQAEELLKKIDEAYVSWGTPPSLTSSISEAGPPLVELPTPLSQRAAQLAMAIEGTSGAPTAWELAQIELLSKKIPEAAAIVRKLIAEDLDALNKKMREANVPYVSAGMGGGGQRPPQTEEDGDIDR